MDKAIADTVKSVKGFKKTNIEKEARIATDRQVGGKFYRPIESYDDTFKQKLREANLGEKNPMYGKARSEETKRKISQTLKEKTWQ